MQAQYFHYEILETYGLDELPNHKDHRRLKVFYEKGCKCVECGVEATQLALGKDRMGNLHLDVYTDDFYPLTVDHILPKSFGGSDHIDNLQPMCCLCNWRKGNGLFPANVGRKKYHTPTYNITPLVKIDYDNSDIKIGDTVFKPNGPRSKNRWREIGIVNELYINPHTGKESVKVINKRESYYHLNSIYKQLDGK
jgi:hypothetical protein